MNVDLGSQFEEILTKIRGTGRYQYITVFFVLLPTFFACSFISSAWLFVIAVPDHYSCHIPLDGFNESLEAGWKQRLLPPGYDGEPYSKCEVYAFNYSGLAEELGSIHALESYLNGTNGSIPRETCASWDFDKSVYESTIVTDWDLVCAGRDFLPTLAYIVSSLGVMAGTPLGGYAADKIGRKATYFGFFFLQLVFGAATATAPQAHYGYFVYLSLYTLHSVAMNPTYLVPSTLGLEIITPDFRATFLVLLTMSYTFGGMVFTGIAYAIRSWRPMLLATVLPFIFYGLLWFAMPESPRWLLSKRRFEDVQLFLRRVAKTNGVEWDTSLEQKFSQLCRDSSMASTAEQTSPADKAHTYLDLFRRPKIRRNTLLMVVMSIVVQVCYNGLGYYAPTLGSDPYLSFFLSCVVEIPGALLIQMVCDRIGRRLTIFLCFIIGGTACLSTLALPAKNAPFVGILTLFLVAKMFVTAAYSVQELMVNELLPTVVRGKGVALTNFISSLAANTGPIIVYSGNSGHNGDSTESLSLVIFGGIMIFASVCSLFIPETLNRPLPETLAECEEMDRSRSSWKDAFVFWQPAKRYSLERLATPAPTASKATGFVVPLSYQLDIRA